MSKSTRTLSENDLKVIVADYLRRNENLDVAVKDVHIDITPAYQDGPRGSAAFATARVDIPAKPLELKV